MIHRRLVVQKLQHREVGANALGSRGDNGFNLSSLTACMERATI
jgi:hypothetical protein